MPDREKVIRGLEVCSTVEDLAPCPNECPYHKPDAVCYGTARLMRDALALLREQEPVGVVKGIGYLYCGGCKTALAPLDWPKPWKFCPWCGRRVRWEEDDGK